MLALIFLALASSCFIGLAAEPLVIVQRQHSFSQTQMTIPRNTTIDFQNEDDVPHRFEITGDTMAFSSGLQMQGATVSVLFPDPGKFHVQCTIHPRMKVTIRVE